MKNLLLFLITCTMFFNYDLSSWASEFNTKNYYSVETEYKNNFLLSNSNNSIMNISFELEKKSDSPNNWLLLWSILFPGTGQLAMGENVWGTWLLTLALIPTAFMIFAVIILSGVRSFDELGPRFAILIGGVISAVFYVIVYIINLINISTLATINFKKQEKKNLIQKHEIEKINNENFVKNFNEIIKNIRYEKQSLVYNLNF